jgi:hypothetical protein
VKALSDIRNSASMKGFSIIIQLRGAISILGAQCKVSIAKKVFDTKGDSRGVYLEKEAFK